MYTSIFEKQFKKNKNNNNNKSGTPAEMWLTPDAVDNYISIEIFQQTSV